MHLRPLLDLLVPPVCLVCRAPGGELCGSCRRALPWLVGPCCARCGLPAPCGRRCPALAHAYAAAWAPFAHEGPARTLIAALKFRRATAAADVLAAAIAATAPAEFLGAVAIVPVPAHPGRRRSRGVDHTRLLARAVARRTGVPCAAGALRRERDGAHQLGSGRDERLRAGRLAVRANEPVPSGRVVLLDDVHTTGATLDACARALRAAGATDVVAIAAARSLRGNPC